MKIELKKLNKPDGKVYYAVVKDSFYTTPFYTTQLEGEEAFKKAVEFAKNGPPQEEILLSTEI